MRVLVAVVLAVLLAACGGPSPTAPATSAPATAGSPSARAAVSPSAGPSIDPSSVAGQLPASVNGVPTNRSQMSPSSRNSPRVFLKVIARLEKKPPDGQVGLGFTPDATIYAVRVSGVSGADIARAFVADRSGAAAASAIPTVTIAGHQVTQVGDSGGNYLYSNGDTFFYLETPNVATATDVIRQLP